MAEQHLCQRHGRPAVASRVRTRPDGTQEVEYLCEIDLAEERMSSRLGGGRSLFDEFFSDFFDRSPAGAGAAPAPAQAPARRAESVDVTQFFSDATRPLLQRAAQTALEWGSLDLESDHLLYGALQDDVVRHVLEQVGADPAAIAAQLEEEAEQAERTDVAPSLAPDARPRCSPPTRSRASSVPPTSAPSTCCSPSRVTKSRLRGSCCSGSVSRTRSCAARSSAAWTRALRVSSRARRGWRSSAATSPRRRARVSSTR